ncbi:hypothetical protein HK101_012061, partial [Irineochytrium annulatum]
ARARAAGSPPAWRPTSAPASPSRTTSRRPHPVPRPPTAAAACAPSPPWPCRRRPSPTTITRPLRGPLSCLGMMARVSRTSRRGSWAGRRAGGGSSRRPAGRPRARLRSSPVRRTFPSRRSRSRSIRPPCRPLGGRRGSIGFT